MAIEPAERVIPAHSKFTSELDVTNPAERKEMNARVFGRDYRTGRDGKPVDLSRGSDAFWVGDLHMPEDPKEQQVLLKRLRDTFNAHITAIRTYSKKGFCPHAQQHSFQDDAIEEAGRINDLRRAKGLDPLPMPGTAV